MFVQKYCTIINQGHQKPSGYHEEKCSQLDMVIWYTVTLLHKKLIRPQHG